MTVVRSNLGHIFDYRINDFDNGEAPAQLVKRTAILDQFEFHWALLSIR